MSTKAKLVLLLIASFLALSTKTNATSNGFILEMIHPISQTNMSDEQRIQVSVTRSLLRANYLTSNMMSRRLSKSTTFNQELDTARPLVDLQGFHYIVKVGIGMLRSKPTYVDCYLDMDTGSSLTWMQCEGCTKCFRQKPKPFPRNKSSTFHSIINQQDNKPLIYNSRYADGSYSSGILAKETIHLNSNNGSTKRVQSFIFGCGLDNLMEYGDDKNNRIAGVMGLGWGDHSFVNQIKESKGRFSYCLPLITSINKKRLKTYLRLGDDIVIQGQKAASTTLTRVHGIYAYFVALQGISIDKKRLNISQQVFVRPNGSSKGGCIIDSGTTYSRIIKPAYTILRQGLEDYFSKNKNLRRIKSSSLGLDLCYERRVQEGFKNLPDITFHFQGSPACLRVRPDGSFEFFKKLNSFRYHECFCLAMTPSTRLSIIGAHQQINQRIIYDTHNEKLIFYNDDCSKNP